MMNEQLENLRSDVAKILNAESVDVDQSLGDIGIDSLNMVELMIICEQLYPGSIDLSQLKIDQFTTLRSLDEQLRIQVS
jgi:acyl carrier protein